MKKYLSVSLVILLSISAALSAEDFTVKHLTMVSIPLEPQRELTNSLLIDEALGLDIDEDSQFIQGIQIEIKTPIEVPLPVKSVAFEFWNNINNFQEKATSFSGDKIITQVMPNRAGLTLQVPVRADYNIRVSPFTMLINTVADRKTAPFIFKIVAVDGSTIPPELLTAHWQVTVRPIFRELGSLRVTIKYPKGLESKPYTVYLDDSALTSKNNFNGKDSFVIKSGRHYLRVVSEDFRDENVSFSLDPGGQADLSIELRDATPIAILEAPSNAIISFDDSRVDHVRYPSFSISVGEHIVICQIGNYSLTRKFTAVRGKTYKIVLALDMQVQELPQ